MDLKEYSGDVVAWVGVLYAVTLIARFRTRYKATCSECALVVALLFGAAVLVPIFLGAVAVAK